MRPTLLSPQPPHPLLSPTAPLSHNPPTLSSLSPLCSSLSLAGRCAGHHSHKACLDQWLKTSAVPPLPTRAHPHPPLSLSHTHTHTRTHARTHTRSLYLFLSLSNTPEGRNTQTRIPAAATTTFHPTCCFAKARSDGPRDTRRIRIRIQRRKRIRPRRGPAAAASQSWNRLGAVRGPETRGRIRVRRGPAAAAAAAAVLPSRETGHMIPEWPRRRVSCLGLHGRRRESHPTSSLDIVSRVYSFTHTPPNVLRRRGGFGAAAAGLPG